MFGFDVDFLPPLLPVFWRDCAKFRPGFADGACLSTLEGHTATVSALSFTSSGQLVSGSWDGSLRLWDLNTGTSTRRLTTSFIRRREEAF